MGTLFGQRLIDGISNGALYGSLALAIALVFRSTGRVNLAQGELSTVGTYLSLVLSTPATAALAGTTFAARWIVGTPWSLWLAIPAAMLVSAVLAALIERLLLRRVPEHDERRALSLTVALLLLLNALTTQLFGSGTKAYPSPFPAGPQDQWALWGVRLRFTTVGTWLTLLVVLGALHLLLTRTRFGLAFRAVSSSWTSSALCGIRVSRTSAGAWALAAALGTLVGCLAATRLVLNPSMMTRLLVYALVASTIGGLGSPAGALIGGLIVGVGQSMLAGYVPRVDGVLAFPLLVLVMVVTLFVRPGGLFGSRSMRQQRADDVSSGSSGSGPSAEVGDEAVAAGAAITATRLRIVRGTTRWRILVSVAAVGGSVALIVPALLLPYLEARMLTEIVALTVALWGLGFLVGDAGCISFAHATFMGIGAYSTAIMAARYGLHPFVGVAVAGMVGFVAGALLSLPAVRIRGQYLAMVTFALAVVFPSMLNRFKWFTGGEYGPPPTTVPRGPAWLGLPPERTFAWLHIVAVVVAVSLGWMLSNLRNGAFGRAVRAGAQHEAAATAMGVDTTRVRTLSFAFASLLAAVGGSIAGLQTQAVTAARFDVMRSLAMYALVVTFGAGSLPGAALAAVAFVGTPYLIVELGLPIGGRGVPPDVPGGGAYLVWGAVLVVATVALPQGVVPVLARWLRRVITVVDGDRPGDRPDQLSSKA